MQKKINFANHRPRSKLLMKKIITLVFIWRYWSVDITLPRCCNDSANHPDALSCYIRFSTQHQWMKYRATPCTWPLYTTAKVYYSNVALKVYSCITHLLTGYLVNWKRWLQCSLNCSKFYKSSAALNVNTCIRLSGELQIVAAILHQVFAPFNENPQLNCSDDW